MNLSKYFSCIYNSGPIYKFSVLNKTGAVGTFFFRFRVNITTTNMFYATFFILGNLKTSISVESST